MFISFTDTSLRIMLRFLLHRNMHANRLSFSKMGIFKYYNKRENTVKGLETKTAGITLKPKDSIRLN